MNVLLITFSFPPAGGVGVLRALSLAKYLPESGIRVDVLTAKNAPAVGKDSSLLAQVPAAVTVHRTWTLDLPFFIRKRIKKAVAGRASSPAEPAKVEDTKSSRQSWLKKTVGNLLLPDPQVGWLPFAFPAAKHIVKSRAIDLVLITVPPFSTVKLAARLRAEFPGLPVVLDFRDEWLSTTLHLVSFNSNARAKTVATQCEGEAVRAATCVVAVTEAARAELIGRYPNERAEKFRCIPNGFDSKGGAATTSAESAPKQGDSILLTYIGTVYGSTDPSNFVEAVLALPEALRRRLRVRYVGHVETVAYRETLLKLGDSIELRGFMPQAEALRLIDETDYLLLITHDRMNVAAKFYDYLAGGKPIFAAVHPDGDVRRLLEETGAGQWADVGSPQAIGALLKQVLAGGSSTGDAASGSAPVRKPEVIAQFHRRALTQRYAALLQSLADEGSTTGEAR